MRKTVKKTVRIRNRFHLSNEVKYDITTVNGIEKARELIYTGAKLHNYSLVPLYKLDLNLLKKENPFYENDGNWFSGSELPIDPEKIDLNEVTYVRAETFDFFDINKEPIPIVFKVDYIIGRITNLYFDLNIIYPILEKHPNVINIEKIDVPYYNEDGGSHAIELLILPEKSWLEKYHSETDYITLQEFCIGQVWNTEVNGFFDLKKYAKTLEYIG